MTRIKRKRNLDNDLEQWIITKARLRYSPAEIYRQMSDADEFKDRDNLPSLRTVQRVVEDLTISDATAKWTISNIKVDVENISLDDARLVLDVLRSIFLITHGRIRNFTVREVQWILKIAKLEPQRSHFYIWDSAQKYIYREIKGIDTEDLELHTTFNPGGSRANLRSWFIATREEKMIILNTTSIPPLEKEIDLQDEWNIIGHLAGLYPKDPVLYDSELTPKEIGDFLNESEDSVKRVIQLLKICKNKEVKP